MDAMREYKPVELLFEEVLNYLRDFTQAIPSKPLVYLLGYEQEPKETKKVFKRLYKDLTYLWGKENFICPTFDLEHGGEKLARIHWMEKCQFIIVFCTKALKEAYDDFKKIQAFSNKELSQVFTLLGSNEHKIVPFCRVEDREHIPFFLRNLKEIPIHNEEDYQDGIFALLRVIVGNPALQKLIQEYKKSIKKTNKAYQTLILKEQREQITTSSYNSISSQLTDSKLKNNIALNRLDNLEKLIIEYAAFNRSLGSSRKKSFKNWLNEFEYKDYLNATDGYVNAARKSFFYPVNAENKSLERGKGIDLSQAIFCYVNFLATDFRYVNLIRVDFTESDLTYTNMTWALIDATDLAGAKSNPDDIRVDEEDHINIIVRKAAAEIRHKEIENQRLREEISKLKEENEAIKKQQGILLI